MRIAVLSDIHSNLEALQAVLEALPPVERILCLGDIVGYGADPAAVIDLLRERGAEGVQGNHDWAVATGETGWFDPRAARAIEWTRSVLDRGPADYLRRLPPTLELPDLDLLAVHGSPLDPLFEYVVDEKSAGDSFGATRRRVILLGHSHVAMRYVLRDGRETTPDPKSSVENAGWRVRGGLERRAFPEGGAEPLGPPLILNPGSVGQPRDGNPKASFAILSLGEGEEFEIRRVEYDWNRAARKIRDAGLPEFLAARLLRGV